MRLLWQTSKFVMDEGRFTKAVSDLLIARMMSASREAFKDNFHRIPIWSGESRGGMRATARALGLEGLLGGRFPPQALKQKRRNRFGQLKGPNSAESNFDPPRRTTRNRVQMFIKNEADGFLHADKRKQKNTGPWKFSAGFSRSFRRHLKNEIRKNPKLPIASFVVRQRAVKRG